MERHEGLKEHEYRKVSYFDGNETKYIIEKRKGNKWKYCFGGIDYKEANHFLNHPYLIESQMKSFNITVYCILAFLVISILYFVIKD